jgi:deoxyribodipyrimidine photo-lyase
MAGKRGGRACAYWLRYDLRLDDNPALQAACEGAASLLPVYVLDPAAHYRPTLAGAKKSSARRARFLLESLACLRRRLELKGSGLAVALGKPAEVLPRLCGGCGCSTVTVGQGVCSEETAEEARVAKRLKSADLKRVWGGTLYLPEEVGCTPNNTPLLFTNFKNKAEGRGRIRNPLDAPRSLPPLPEPEAGLKEELAQALKFLPTLEQLGYPAEDARAALQDDPRGVMPFEGGEEAALRRLQTWMFDDDKLKDYFQIRNGMLGDGYSSKLSPWLATGCISPRRIWKEAQRYENERTKKQVHLLVDI